MSAILFAFLPSFTANAQEITRRPNIVFILADDLGYGDLGCYGQTKIRTPRLDDLAKKGLRFTQHYSGNAVCAPSRCVLMTGLHSGHAFIRNNQEAQPEGQHPIPPETVTIAKLLKRAGYVTGAIGKWGLGPVGSTGEPAKQGFDFFFGYNCQRHAHNHYPQWLWRNDQKEMYDTPPFSQDLFDKEAEGFLRQNKDKPFFLYLPFIIPHVALQVPEDSLAEYKGKFDEPPYKGGKGYLPHETPHAALAAMITRLDRSVGKVVDLLKELGLEENTLVIFSSDNGPVGNGVGGSDADFFRSKGPLRDYKGSLFEGGIRVPMIAYWKGRVRPGTSALISGFQDVLPTLCDLAGLEKPKTTDGISYLPTLLGAGKQPVHEYLYWEFSAYGGQQAVRMGDWKGIRQGLAKGPAPVQLYNLKNDLGETTNLADRHPDIIAKIERIMKESHEPSEVFPLKGLDAPAKE